MLTDLNWLSTIVLSGGAFTEHSLLLFPKYLEYAPVKLYFSSFCSCLLFCGSTCCRGSQLLRCPWLPAEQGWSCFSQLILAACSCGIGYLPTHPPLLFRTQPSFSLILGSWGSVRKGTGHLSTSVRLAVPSGTLCIWDIIIGAENKYDQELRLYFLWTCDKSLNTVTSRG